MRIAFIGIKGIPSRFGADRVVEAIVERLHVRHEITVYCSSQFTCLDFKFPNVRLIPLPCLPGKYTHMTSVDLLAAWHSVLFGNYDLIHLHHIEASFVLPILKLKYKVISTAHGRITAGSKWGNIAAKVMQSMEIPYALLSDIATSVSIQQAEELKHRFQRDIIYIPNGVSRTQPVNYNAAQRILLLEGIRDNNFILFAAGRIIPLKGVHLLMEAYSKIDRDCKLLIVGDLSSSQEYARKLRSYRDSRIRFLPFISSQEELYGLVKLCCLFIFPSLYEAMSMMLIEAASLGAPILCSDIPANKSVLMDQALFFQSESIRDLTEKLEWALCHAQEMREYGVKVRDWVNERYSWDSIIEKYDSLYWRTIDQDHMVTHELDISRKN